MEETRKNMDGSAEAASPTAAPSKTHLEILRDQYSAAQSQVKYWNDRADKLNREIQVILHKERGIEIGFVLENRDGRAIVDRLNRYWLFGRFLKKDGTPGTRERTIYDPYKVIAKSWHELAPKAQEGGA